MPLYPGQVLNGRYQVVAEVGSGHFCIVYSGVDKKNNDAPVAIKALREDRHCDLHREYDSLQGLEDHMYTATPIVYGDGSDNQTYYVTSLEGQELFQLGCETIGCLPERVGMKIMLHALMALQNLHQQGKTHGDISSRNMVLSKTAGKGSILLVDMALSRDFYELGAKRDIGDMISAMSLFNNSIFYKTIAREYSEKKYSIAELIAMIKAHYAIGEDEQLDFNEQ